MNGEPPSWSDNARIGRGLGVLGAGLDAYLAGRYGASWPELLSAHDAARDITGKKYARHDPQCGLRMITETIGAVQKLPGDLKKAAARIRDVRAGWAHFEPIDTADADDALHAMADLLDALGQPGYGDQIRQLGRAPWPDPTPNARHIPWERAQFTGDRVNQAAAFRYSSRPPTSFVPGGLIRGRREAKRAYEAQQAEVVALNNRGAGLEGQQRYAEAEAKYIAAATAGSIPALANAARMFLRRGQPAAAETWFRQGADHGDVEAMLGLRDLLNAQGKIDEATTWDQRATSTPRFPQ